MLKKFKKQKKEKVVEEKNNKEKVPSISFKSLDLVKKLIDWVEGPNTPYYEFGLVLKRSGYSEYDSLLLENYDENTFSFDCYSIYSKKRKRISLRYGDFMDHFPTITIEDDKSIKYYEYCFKNGETILRLANYTNKLDSGINITRYLFETTFLMIIKKDDMELCVSITPNNSHIDWDSNFRMKNDRELEEYINSLTFPINIVEVYKRICEISIEKIEDYSKFKISVVKKIDNKKEELYDKICLKNGELDNFTITRDGKTISLNSDNAWELKTDKTVVKKNNEGNIDYSISYKSEDDITLMPTPKENIDNAKKDVNDVIVLSKTLFK